ncbi:MAG TPA: dehydrogenase [Cytophagales bacterium]|nr:dehydrogenase [Cytophagales bacterium]HAA23650.1 dehydrogenase [Cytophagales bacterium]HAP65373.1 dehydrogenase [Cytophagales bacterium]
MEPLTATTLLHSAASSQLRAISPPPSPRIRAKGAFSMVSQGTERKVLTGTMREETAQHMRVPYMQGDFAGEFSYGYSWVGQVEEGPKEWLGAWVHLLHPHQTHAWVEEKDLYRIPEGVTPEGATLASNMETAVNALWDGQVMPGDRVLIVGMGLIGVLVGLLVREIPGVEVFTTDLADQRQQLAQQLGFRCSAEPEFTAAFDVAFHTSTTTSGLQAALDAVGMEGKVVELSWHSQPTNGLVLGEDFHYLRKQIISSQVSTIPPSHQHRWDYRRRKDLVFKLLPRLPLKALLAHRISFWESPQFFDQLRQGAPTQLTTFIEYS